MKSESIESHHQEDASHSHWMARCYNGLGTTSDLSRFLHDTGAIRVQKGKDTWLVCDCPLPMVHGVTRIMLGETITAYCTVCGDVTRSLGYSQVGFLNQIKSLMGF